ncbi:MAG: orotate phosphoribosyltransferase [Candidatus Eremiobacteraeota bacterium]|nr:orotate phosphoribosyltransferase [Candidatus Eremiobacteraeota bacterium]
MNPSELLERLTRRGALLSGHFRLSSGLHSDRFIQKFRIFEDPPTAEAVGAALADLLRPQHPEVVVSAAIGGILPGYIVAKHLGVRNIFVEKDAGVPKLRRGFSLRPGERVAIVEDVMTTGKSTAEVIELVKAQGAEVSAIGAIVKRGKAALPYPVIALLELPLADYAPDECPLCRQGIALEDPGSRRSG